MTVRAERRIDIAFGFVRKELDKATDRFGAFASSHEGIAVIEEEFLELRSEVFWGKRAEPMLQEAVQLAAMAIRFIVDVSMKDPRDG